MSRSPSESSLFDVPGCGMHAPPLQAIEKPATGIDVGPVNVDALGFAKFTENLKRGSAFEPRLSTKFGVPDGGNVWPSRSDDNSDAFDTWKQTCVAVAPANIAFL